MVDKRRTRYGGLDAVKPEKVDSAEFDADPLQQLAQHAACQSESATVVDSYQNMDMSKIPASLRLLLNAPPHSEKNGTKPDVIKPDVVKPDTVKMETAKSDTSDHDTRPVKRQRQQISNTSSDQSWFYSSSANPIAFLKSCRLLCAESPVMNLKDSSFVNVVKKPEPRNKEHKNTAMHSLPLRNYTDFVVNLFLQNVNQMIYMVDEQDFKGIVEEIYSNPVDAPQRSLCLLNLVLAVGSLFAKALQSFASAKFPFPKVIEPVIFYNSGVEILHSMPSEITLWRLKVHFILGAYHLFDENSNEAWIELNMALRIAEVYGLNKKEANSAYTDQAYILHRKRTWRSLYIADRLVSPMLGRSLCIPESNSSEVYEPLGLVRDYLEECQIQAVRICTITGRIHEYLYYGGNSMKFQKLKEFGLMIKNWSLKLPYELKVSAVLELDKVYGRLSVDLNDTKYAYHPLYVTYLCAIYATLLLTRPCFQFVILRELNMSSNKGDSRYANLSPNSFIRIFANSSYAASKFIINFAVYFLARGLSPDKPFTFISVMFQSGLTVGLAYYAQVAHRTHNPHGVEDVPFLKENNEALLLSTICSIDAFSKFDGRSSRYVEILKDLHAAIKSRDTSTHLYRYEENEQYAVHKNFDEFLFTGLSSTTEASQLADIRMLNDFYEDFNKEEHRGITFDGSF